MSSEEPVIRCESVYMIFGDNAHSMLKQANGVVDHARFHEAGCIVGVNNASFEVYKGELLIIMGLSGSGKSTLMRCIARLTRNSVRATGRSCRCWPGSATPRVWRLPRAGRWKPG